VIEMLQAHRRSQILSELRSRPAVSVGELARLLGTSEMTIRRDLRALDGEGLLEKVHGGAIPVGQTHQPLDHTADVRSTFNVDAKASIARVAATMVADGATLVLDSGTTVGMLARALRGRRLVVVTTSMIVLRELQGEAAVTIHVIGGRYRPETQSVTGPQVAEALAEFSADLAFLGASAIRGGSFYNYYPEDAPIQRGMADIASQAWLLADSSKLAAVAAGRVGLVSGLAGVVTDTAAPPDALGELRSWCGDLIVAPSGEPVAEGAR
jgi:DeoR family fructose operon transcriptional repressor